MALNGKFKRAEEVFYIALVIMAFVHFGCGKDEISRVQDMQDCDHCHTVPPDSSLVHQLTSASTYAYDCHICHYGYSYKQSLENKDIHLNNHPDILFDTAYLNEIFPFKDTAGLFDTLYNWEMAYDNGTCYNIPCHGSGRIVFDWEPRGEDSLGVWIMGRDRVRWYINAQSSEPMGCESCHETSNHRPANNCIEECHNADNIILDSLTIADFSLHVNGIVEGYEE